MLNVEIVYFALLKDQARKEREMLQTTAKTSAELYHILSKQYDFTLDQKYLMVAINDEFTSFDVELKEGDKVVFIPPVAGG